MTIKQIFDWMREEINATIGVELFGEEYTGIKRVNRIINEAEAKWESDCCEWKLEENTGIAWHCADEKCSTYNSSYIKNLRIVLEDFDCICPYCGKPIKISEEE